MISRIFLITLISMNAVRLWGQQDAAASVGVGSNDDSQMAVPPPVSATPYGSEVAGESRSNFLRGGLTFTTLYSDDVFGDVAAPISDVSYSIGPFIALDETTSRLHLGINFDPGFTFYQRTTARNEAAENFGLSVSYRLSPHVTFSVVDSFHKSSNFLNQPLASQTPVFGSVSASPVTVVPPLADQLNNSGTAQLTYQFGLNAMVGVSGTFTVLDYPNKNEVPGLFNSRSRAGSAFYNHRISRRHYIGATYQYQALYAYPTGFRAETQTSAAMAFYTLYLQPALSISFFGGPQYSDTQVGSFPSTKSWTPAAGASIGLQGRQTTLGLNYSRMIAQGGGLVGAVHQDAASIFVRRQFLRVYNGGIQLSYSNTQLLQSTELLGLGGANSGHTIQGAASLGRQLGPHFALALNYTRLHQTYSGITAISRQPNTNLGSVSISYQFTRPLGR